MHAHASDIKHSAAAECSVVLNTVNTACCVMQAAVFLVQPSCVRLYCSVKLCATCIAIAQHLGPGTTSCVCSCKSLASVKCNVASRLCDLQTKKKPGKLRMQEANTDNKFRKGQKDADFFKKLHKVSSLVLLQLCISLQRCKVALRWRRKCTERQLTQRCMLVVLVKRSNVVPADYRIMSGLPYRLMGALKRQP